MIMELLDGYRQPILSQQDFIWVTRDYMGDEAADYLQQLLTDTYQLGYDTASEEAEDQIKELDEKIEALNKLLEEGE